jgi:hypothetical protein
MKNSIRVTLLVVVSSILAAIPAQATDITLFGGTQQPGALSLQTIGGAITSFSPATFGTYGVRFSAGRVIGTEQTFAYSPNFLTTDSHAFWYYGNILAQVPSIRFRPYATAGIGTAIIGGGPIEAIKGSKFGLNYGGGIKLRLAGPAGLQFDARGHSLFGVAEDTLNVLEVSLGLMFTF